MSVTNEFGGVRSIKDQRWCRGSWKEYWTWYDTGSIILKTWKLPHHIKKRKMSIWGVAGQLVRIYPFRTRYVNWYSKREDYSGLAQTNRQIRGEIVLANGTTLSSFHGIKTDRRSTDQCQYNTSFVSIKGTKYKTS